MTVLFLDTEFNGYGGELISLALVPSDRGAAEWYEVLEPSESIVYDAFVVLNVMPFLGQSELPRSSFSSKLLGYLRQHDGATIVADWPADVAYLCELLTEHGRDNGWLMPVELSFKLINTPKLYPETPHNALSDARAIRDWWLTRPGQVA